jgi:hypothetical protein
MAIALTFEECSSLLSYYKRKKIEQLELMHLPARRTITQRQFPVP